MYQFTATRMGQPAASRTVRRRRSSTRLLLVVAATIQLVAMTILGVGPAAAESESTFEVSLYCGDRSTPTLSWDAVPLAQSYEVQTSSVVDDGGRPPYWTTFRTDHVRYGHYSTATNVHNTPCYHRHEYRIRAMRSDGSVVATSTIIGTGGDQIATTFPEPRNLRPAWTNNPWGGGSFDRLTWTGVPGAEGYNVYDATTDRYLTTVRTTWYDPIFPRDFYVTAFDGNGNFSTRSNTATVDAGIGW